MPRLKEESLLKAHEPAPGRLGSLSSANRLERNDAPERTKDTTCLVYSLHVPLLFTIFSWGITVPEDKSRIFRLYRPYASLLISSYSYRVLRA